MKDERAGAIVVGGGLAGLSAALGLARTGRAVTVFDPAADERDPRTTAMLRPTIENLRAWGVWDRIEAETAPLRTMRIIDGSRRLVRAPTVTFDAAEIGEEAFGHNVPNAVATGALRDALEACDNASVVRLPVEHVALRDEVAEVQAGGATHRAGLVVGADGRGSLVRRAANIAASERSYPQAALVTTFEHELPHRNISTEFHAEHGPATQVPLPGDRSSLVWMDRPDRIARLSELDPSALAPEIEKRLDSLLGAVAIDGPVGTFPMSVMSAAAYSGRRAVLVGEAAHAFPPIGAQGFNLTMRDVADLVELQRDAVDPGARALMEGYRRMRDRDAATRTLAVDALNRSLLSGLLPVQLAKALGLAALKALPPLRQAIMREGLLARSTRVRNGSDAVQVLSGIAARGAEQLRRRRPGRRPGGVDPMRRA